MTQKKVSYLPSGREEILKWTYFSTRRISATAVIKNTTLDFFTYTIGQVIDSVSATDVDTNVKKVNAIEQPNRFYIKSVDLNIIPASTIHSTINTSATPSAEVNVHLDEILNILNNGKFSINVLTKTVMEVATINELLTPCQILPNGYTTVRKAYQLKKPILLMPEISFIPSIKFGNDTATVGASAIKIVCRLHGDLIRPSDM